MLLLILSGTLGDTGNKLRSVHINSQNAFMVTSLPFSPIYTHMLILCSNYKHPLAATSCL